MAATPIPALLVADQVGYTDLDGDGQLEAVLLEGPEGSLVITDGKVVYRSRGRWRVVEACLGDVTGDGLPEVVALLDADDGRHLGLFAYYGGEYRERLVTKEFNPAPVALEVVDRADLLAAAPAVGGAGDIVVLVYDPGQGDSAGYRTMLRWNGFSFTRVEDGSLP
jgi:hypothetical protein